MRTLSRRLDALEQRDAPSGFVLLLLDEAAEYHAALERGDTRAARAVLERVGGAPWTGELLRAEPLETLR